MNENLFCSVLFPYFLIINPMCSAAGGGLQNKLGHAVFTEWRCVAPRKKIFVEIFPFLVVEQKKGEEML